MVDDRDFDIFDIDTLGDEPEEEAVDADIDTLLTGLDSALSEASEEIPEDEDWSFLNETPDSPPQEEPKEEPKQRKRKEKKRKERAPEPELTGFAAAIAKHHRPINAVLFLLSVVLFLAIICTLFLHVNKDPFDYQILNNVSIAGVPVGGMSQSEAVQAVTDTLKTGYANQTMTVVFAGQEITLPASVIQSTPDAKQAVEKAYALGRTGTASERQKAFRLAQNSQVTVDISDLLGLNGEAIWNAIQDAASKLESDFIPSGYLLDGQAPALDADNFNSTVPCQTLMLTVGQPGTGTNVDAIYRSVLEAYSNRSFRVEVPAEYLPQMPEELNLDAIYAEIASAPVEAAIDPATGEEVPGVCGYTFSLDNAREKLSNASYGDTVAIPMEYVLPENLELNGDFTETLASYATPLGNLTTYDQNMKLFCDAIDGLVIEPGATLSLNSQVPVRNESTGYMPAVKHAGYCLTEHAAGGVDQVASTLYAAALMADLKIAEKHYADHICGYTTAGTELTVESSWQDLKIQNPYQTPIKIRAKLNSTHVVIRILGQEALGYYIELDSEASRTNNPGVVYVPQNGSAAYANNDVILQGTPGGSYKLNIVRYSMDTKQEISRDAQYADLPAANKYIASAK